MTMSETDENSEFFRRTYIWVSRCWYCRSDIKLAYTLVEIDIHGQYDRGLNSHIPAIDIIDKIGDKELLFELMYDKIGNYSSYNCVCPQCDKETNKNDIREELFNIFSLNRSELIPWRDKNLKHQEQISREQAYSGMKFR